MATPILTTRELRNEDTGIDITVPTYKEIPGLLSTTAEYHVIVISKLSYFKTPKHKDNDIVQFMVPKKYGDFEELHKTLDEMYSGTAFPELPKKTLLIKDSTVQERRRCFDRLMVFIAENHKVCCSPPVLEFLGVNPIKAGRYRKNIDVDVKPKKSQETTEKDEGTVKQLSTSARARGSRQPKTEEHGNQLYTRVPKHAKPTGLLLLKTEGKPERAEPSTLQQLPPFPVRTARDSSGRRLASPVICGPIEHDFPNPNSSHRRTNNKHEHTLDDEYYYPIACIYLSIRPKQKSFHMVSM
ncbi:uncharacterized protein LOC144346423 [Saccoglossus kowalevskii]